MAEGHPVACALSSDDYRRRLLEVAALSREALTHVEQRGLELHLRYVPEAAARVRRLVAQERACCGFLDFSLDEGPDAVRLVVMFPEAARDAVPELLEELTGRPGAFDMPHARSMGDNRGGVRP